MILSAATVVTAIVPQKPDDYYGDNDPPGITAAEQTIVVTAGITVVVAAISQGESHLSENHINKRISSNDWFHSNRCSKRAIRKG